MQTKSIKLTLAYDGTAYSGWQIQPGRPTIQAALEAAISKVTFQTTRVVASGRTDAGVHALGQVVSFQTESHLTCDVLRRAINAELSRDIGVLEVAEAPAGFHAIRDAVRKRYRYIIHDGPVRDVFARQYCWQYGYGRLDAEAMDRAAKRLLGKHDFSSFESSGAERLTSIRTILDISVRRDGDQIILEVEADGFLYNMVRAIVGTLVEVGRGTQDATWVDAVLHATDRGEAGLTAPPQGLFLVCVTYEG